MLPRREILERDPPFDVKGALQAIRNLTGWGSSDLAFVLNVPRSTLTSWEGRGPKPGSRPNIDDGDAIRKLLHNCRNCVT